MSEHWSEPAFPVLADSSHYYGITARDYFAAKALQGLLACPEHRGTWGDFAKDAYRFADAMLEQREK